MMCQKYKTVLILAVTGISILVISLFLTLTINQARRLINLYTASATGASNLLRPSAGNDALILVVTAAVLFLLVVRRPYRLLPVSIIAALIFITLNLYSGRHVLPQLLIWPTPVSLSEQYIQALAADELESVLRLTNRSDECETIMGQVFQDHQARLKQRIGKERSETTIRDISVKRIVTFYDKPVPQGFVIMQPTPKQLATIMVTLENGRTIWLNLKMSYSPFLGTRYICGQDIDSSWEEIK